jgi:hypothetical protein
MIGCRSEGAQRASHESGAGGEAGARERACKGDRGGDAPRID